MTSLNPLPNIWGNISSFRKIPTCVDFYWNYLTMFGEWKSTKHWWMWVCDNTIRLTYTGQDIFLRIHTFCNWSITNKDINENCLLPLFKHYWRKKIYKYFQKRIIHINLITCTEYFRRNRWEMLSSCWDLWCLLANVCISPNLCVISDFAKCCASGTVVQAVGI